MKDVFTVQQTMSRICTDTREVRARQRKVIQPEAVPSPTLPASLVRRNVPRVSATTAAAASVTAEGSSAAHTDKTIDPEEEVPALAAPTNALFTERTRTHTHAHEGADSNQGPPDGSKKATRARTTPAASTGCPTESRTQTQTRRGPLIPENSYVTCFAL